MVSLLLLCHSACYNALSVCDYGLKLVFSFGYHIADLVDLMSLACVTPFFEGAWCHQDVDVSFVVLPLTYRYAHYFHVLLVIVMEGYH